MSKFIINLFNKKLTFVLYGKEYLMLKPSKQTIVEAIIREIEQGIPRAKVLAKLGKKWQIAVRTLS